MSITEMAEKLEAICESQTKILSELDRLYCIVLPLAQEKAERDARAEWTELTKDIPLHIKGEYESPFQRSTSSSGS